MAPIYLIRHGLTQPNIDGLITVSREIVPLVPEGRFQARKSGAWLRGQGIAKIFSSPMLRVQQTVEELNLGAPIVEDPRLVEINLGIYEGRPSKELIDEFRWRGLLADKTKGPQGGESLMQIEERLGAFIDECLSREKEPVLVAAHGGSVRVLLSLLCPPQIERVLAEFTGNCEVWRVENQDYVKVFSPLAAD